MLYEYQILKNNYVFLSYIASIFFVLFILLIISRFFLKKQKLKNPKLDVKK